MACFGKRDAGIFSVIAFCLFVGIASSFLVGARADAVDDKAVSGEWEKTSDKDGIEVFKKEIPGSPVIAFKGQGVVNASISKLATILLDESRAKEWMDRLADIKLLRKPSESEYIEYNHIKTPIVMKDRDFVVDSKVEVDPVTKTFILTLKSTDDPLAPKTHYVRGEIMNSSFTLKSLEGKKTYVIAEIFADPKGGVAKWMVNLFQKDWPRNTLESLRRQAAKTDIQENQYYKKIFSKLQRSMSFASSAPSASE